jgi:hypothetical protein
LLVAPIVSAGCILSLYSAAGCDFVRVDVGFPPSNTAWNESTVDIGLFFYQSEEPEITKYMSTLFDGCRPYQGQFDNDFIQDDRTWKVARIMALIAGSAGMVATVR